MIEELLQQRLEAQRQQHRWRLRHVHTPKHDATVIYQKKDLLSFSSNDYLGLATHPEVIQALQIAAQHYGVGSTGSALISGYSNAHHELEIAFAEFTHRDRAIFFGSGTLANLGVITALMQQRSDQIYQDKHNHASLIDAALLSKAKLIRYPHHQLNSLKLALQAPCASSSQSLRLIVSESVFSMDGSIADLHQLAELAKQYHSILMIDDAHGIGVLGTSGKSVAHYLTQDECPLIVCPIGKAFGGYGALVAGSDIIIESILQFARSYIYTTAAPPALASSALVALKLIQSDDWRREKLQGLIGYFKKKAAELELKLLESATPIQSIVLGDSAKAQFLSQALLAKGIYVRDIRPPTVAEGSARLRVSLTVKHSEADIDRLMQVLRDLIKNEL